MVPPSIETRWSRADRFRLGISADLTGTSANPSERTAAQASRCRVAHAVAELHVVGGRTVLVDVDALELAFLRDAQVPGAGDPLDDPEHQQGEPADDDHTRGAADELRLELIPRMIAVEQTGDRAAVV